ncbi:MAG: hypothetical protein ACSLEL_05200 [Candidatus Malihini olakiniferum]
MHQCGFDVFLDLKFQDIPKNGCTYGSCHDRI